MSGGAREPGRTVTSRVIAILGAFDRTHPRLTLTELAQRTGLSLSTVHRLVHELEGGRLLARDPAGGFHVGLRLWELGSSAVGRLRDVAHPWLQDVFARTGDNVHLAVRDGMEVLYIDKVNGRRAVPIVSRVGGRLPLHPTGVGKVLLAHQPSWFLRAYLGRGLERPTAYTITEPGRLAREVDRVRRRGWAVTSEEMTLGSCSLAAPIHDQQGQVVGALGVVLASRRAAELPRLVEPVRTAAAGIEAALRGDDPARPPTVAHALAR